MTLVTKQAPAMVPPTHRSDSRPPRAPRVLVVEDDEDVRDLLVAALAHDGYDVVEAGDGAEALDHVGDCLARGDRSPPDLVLSDIRMPFLSGLHVLASLRRACTIPVILLTAYCDARARDQARRLGAVALLDKPFELDDLRAIARGALAGDPCPRPPRDQLERVSQDLELALAR